MNSPSQHHPGTHRSRFPRQWLILRWLTAPARLSWRWFAHQPRALQVGLVLVLFAAIATGAYFGWSYLKKRSAAKEVGAAWKEHARAVGKADVDEIRAALDRVLALNPDDPTARRHRAMIERGEADPDQLEMAIVLLHHHIRHDRLSEAAREAEKVLARNPKYWHARCVMAHHALQVKKDRALTEHHLAQLPDPEDPAAQVNAGGLLYALRLSDVIGRDAANLRRLIVRRLLPFLRGATAASAAVAAKVQLLECYLEPFTERSLLGELAEYVGVVDRLADSAVNEAVAAWDVDILLRLARFGPRLRAALAAIRADDPARLPDDRFVPLINAVDERTRRAWQAVRDKSPDQVEAYVGLARIALLAGDKNGALTQVMDGIKACGDRVELLEIQLGLYATHGTDEQLLQVAESLRQAAVAAKTDPAKWCLVALVLRQLQPRRNDLAEQACDQALAIERAHPMACRLKAMILVESGSTRQILEARDILAGLGEQALRIDPGLAYLNARIMVESGVWVLVDDEFNKVVERQAKLQPKTMAPAVGFLAGVLSARPTKDRAEWVATRAKRVMQDDPRSSAARLLRFEALYRLADLSVTRDERGGPPLWDPTSVGRALGAFEDVGLEDRARPAVVAFLASLQLKGQRNAATALRTVEVLRESQNSLGAFELEVLGAVLTANGKAGEAVRILERAVKLPNPSVGVRVALAQAYWANHQPDSARAALLLVENTPDRSDREHEEFVFAKRQFIRE